MSMKKPHFAYFLTPCDLIFEAMQKKRWLPACHSHRLLNNWAIRKMYTHYLAKKSASLFCTNAMHDGPSLGAAQMESS